MFPVLRHTTSRRIHHLTRAPSQNQTIYALSTPPGKGGVAVVRVSGPDVQHVWRRLVVPTSGRVHNLRPRHMYRCSVVDDGETLDDGLAVFFQAPHSFTAEHILELHLHSSPATLRRVFFALSRIPGLRPAERGEFTKRAYLAGRINLVEAEGLRDLIEAETETQRKLAWANFNGQIGSHFENLKQQITKALAMVEALIDFGEGEEIDESIYDEAQRFVRSLCNDILQCLQDSRQGEILRSGIKVSIFGPPNAGKSSLLNTLTRRDAAIVTAIPGTTRDVLETSLDIAGLPVRLLDTAGIRHTDDLIEKIGIERARQAIEEADIRLCVLSLPEVLKEGGPPSSVQQLLTSDTLFLFNKIDIAEGNSNSPLIAEGRAWEVSLTTSTGLSDFLEGFGSFLQKRFDFHNNENTILITQNRHKVHLQNALTFLEAFLNISSVEVVLAAEELRYAAQEIGKITGRIDVEDVLDAVFRQFCIGK